MTETLTILGADLGDLAEQINAEQAVRAGLGHARRAGELLIEAKGRCPHGAWLGWLSTNCEVSERSAQLYMQVAREWPTIEGKSATVADLGLRDAIALLAKPQPWYEAPGVPRLLERWIQAEKELKAAARQGLQLAEIGKLAPEGRQYVTERLRKLSGALTDWAAS